MPSVLETGNNFRAALPDHCHAGDGAQVRGGMDLRYLLTAGEAKKLDEHAIRTVGFPGLVLMEKVAMTLASVLMEREDRRSGFLFVCGTGNNGGDGLAAARLLIQQGYRAAVLLVGDPERMSADAKTQMALAAACKVPAVQADAVGSPVYDVIVDAMFGVGLNRAVSGEYEKIISAVNDAGKKVYAADIPSGIHGDNGSVMNVAVRADVTVTFGANKRGLVLYPGCQYAGEVIVGDIGYPEVSYEAVGNPAYYFEPDDLVRIVPKRPPDGHKGTFGRVSVIGGSEGMSGAPLFSAKAAYAAGAGLVKICSVTADREILLSGLPEALFSGYDKADGTADREVLENAVSWADCIVLGPGLGQSARAGNIVSYVLGHCEKPIVLDGDGITLCQEGMLKGKHNVILTPHPKEFSAITGKEISHLKEDFLGEVRAFAERTGVIVAGKDARTVVSDGREIYVNVSGNSGMGTGGSGDVLTGVIAGFLAQGADAFTAAKAGVYVHGLAGDHVSQTYNEYSLTASGLIEGMKAVLGCWNMGR